MLEKVFNGNNIFFRIMGRLGDFICLNLCYLMACIPIVTIGSATCALYEVLYEIGEGKDGHCMIRFWHAMKKYFKRATIYWCICLFLVGIFCVGMSGVQMMNGRIRMLFQAVSVGYVIFLLGFIFIGLILIAWTETSLRTTMRNAFLITIGSFPWLILNIMITSIPAIIIFTGNVYAVANVLPLFLLFGLVLCDYVKMFIYKKILKKYGLLKGEKESQDDIK